MVGNFLQMVMRNIFPLSATDRYDPRQRSAPIWGFEWYRRQGPVGRLPSPPPKFLFLKETVHSLLRKKDYLPCAGLATPSAAPDLYYCPINAAAILPHLRIVVDQCEVECNKLCQPSYDYNRVDN